MADETASPTDGIRGASSATDAELAAGLRAGELTAFNAVYDAHAAPAYVIAFRLLRDVGQAEDVVQEILLSLWEHPEHYDAARGRLRTWILSAVHHRAVDRIRRQARHPQVSLDASAGGDRAIGCTINESGGTTLADLLPAAADDPTAEAEGAERAVAIRAALEQLPAAQREVLLLAYFGGLTQQQIAVHLNEPLGTVKTRARLALSKLGYLLAAYDERVPGASASSSPVPLRAEHEGGNPDGTP